jgi:glycosyltransferase involved in cell wall biosynthesis
MKIVFVHDCANYTINLARALTQLGQQCLVVFQRSLHLPENLRSSQDLTFSECRTDRVLPILRRLTEASDYDVFVSNCRAAWIANTIASKMYRKMHITVLHGSDIRTLNLRGKQILKEGMLLLALKQAHSVMCATSDLMRYRVLLKKPIYELPIPVDMEEFSPQAERLSLPGRPVILSPTRLERGKGGDRIIRLARSIAEQYPRARIYQVRWGEPHLIEQMARTIPKAQLALCDFIPRERFPSWLVSSDLVIGQLEMGIQATLEREAMSCEVPVVVYDLYTDYGIRDKSISALSSYCTQILEDQAFRRKLIDAGRRLVRERYDVRKVAAQLLKVIYS